jgi:hypothetical protein
VKVDEGMKVDPLQPSLKAELEEAKARVVEKEAHFEEVVEEYTPTVQAKKCPTPSKPPSPETLQGISRKYSGVPDDGNQLSDRAALQKAVMETASRGEKEGKPIVLFTLAEAISANDLASVSVILMGDGYRKAGEVDRSDLEIWWWVPLDVAGPLSPGPALCPYDQGPMGGGS